MKRLMMSLVLSAFITFASVSLTKAEENSSYLNSSHMTLLTDAQLKATIAQGIDESYFSYVMDSKDVMAAKIILWDEFGENVNVNANTDQINDAVARH